MADDGDKISDAETGNGSGAGILAVILLLIVLAVLVFVFRDQLGIGSMTDNNIANQIDINVN